MPTSTSQESPDWLPNGPKVILILEDLDCRALAVCSRNQREARQHLRCGGLEACKAKYMLGACTSGLSLTDTCRD